MVRVRPWHVRNPKLLAVERSIWQEVPYFLFEQESIDQEHRVVVVGLLEHRRPRSGKWERLRIRLEYPQNFPWAIQVVYDHDRRLTPGADGHLLEGHRLCLAFEPRQEFSLGSSRLTEEVLGASLVWLDKRGIFDRTRKWPGTAERHGNLALVDLALERAGLAGSPPAVEWAERLYDRWLKERRPVEADIYDLCPCGSGAKLKFCHREPLRILLRALGRQPVGVTSLAKEG